MSRTITLDDTARFDRRRGRNDVASPARRTKINRLEALAIASAGLAFLPPQQYAHAERTVVGLIRLAARSGATVSEIAGATGQPRVWVKARVACFTPSDRGHFRWDA